MIFDHFMVLWFYDSVQSYFSKGLNSAIHPRCGLLVTNIPFCWFFTAVYWAWVRKVKNQRQELSQVLFAVIPPLLYPCTELRLDGGQNTRVLRSYRYRRHQSQECLSYPQARGITYSFSVSSDLCEGKPVRRFGALLMEVTGLRSTPKAQHKDFKMQPRGKNTSVSSQSRSKNQTRWLMHINVVPENRGNPGS